MGSHCDFCQTRCFVERAYPTETKWEYTLMATCSRGMAHDREKTGYNHKTAANPVTDPRFRKTDSEERINLMVRSIVGGLRQVNDQRARIYPDPRPDHLGEIIIELPSFQAQVTERIFRLRVEELPLLEENENELV